MIRILLIDDEPVLGEILKKFLEQAGYEVAVASDGNEGLRLFAENSYDVVITDMLMPNKEGLETILELTEQRPDVKIIATTGGGIGLGDDLLELAIEFGAKRALRKPIPMNELLVVVEEVVRE